MSANRRRSSGMNRSKLKRFSSSMLNGGSTVNTAEQKELYYSKNLNPTVPLPSRHIAWLNRNKHTPTMTEPMKERVESWRIAVKEQTDWFVVNLINSPLSEYKMFYSGHSDRAVYYFTWLDKLSGVKRTSFTLSKDKALAIRENQLRGIPWR